MQSGPQAINVCTQLHRLQGKQKIATIRHPMKGAFLTVAKHISELGRPTRFGPNWPGKRCLAKTQKGTPCQRPAFKHNGRCRLHGGLSTGAKTTDGLKKISGANLKHGKYTKDKLEAQRHAAQVGRRVLAELKRIGGYLPGDF